jgi:hypothetical protein
MIAEYVARGSRPAVRPARKDDTSCLSAARAFNRSVETADAANPVAPAHVCSPAGARSQSHLLSVVCVRSVP